MHEPVVTIGRNKKSSEIGCERRSSFPDARKGPTKTRDLEKEQVLAFVTTPTCVKFSVTGRKRKSEPYPFAGQAKTMRTPRCQRHNASSTVFERALFVLAGLQLLGGNNTLEENATSLSRH